MNDFGISLRVSLIPLTVFVVGYGIGTLLFSPLSENKVIGRNYVYFVTLFLFFILQLPVASAKNITSLSVLRFLTGIFASPALANVGASFTDIFAPPYMPIGLGIWGIAAWCGPSIGPFLGSILVVKGGWRWCFWFMFISSGGCFLMLTFLLPETYRDSILYRKSRSLKSTMQEDGPNFQEAKNFPTIISLIKETLWRPIIISIEEPVVLLINIYIALVYSVVYLWFEAFPIVFLQVHHFTLVEMGTAYLSIIIGVLVGITFYLIYCYKCFTKKLLAEEKVDPEVFLPPAILASILMPISLFIFGWTTAKDIHWIGPLIGAAIFGASGILNFQTLLNYLGMSFPRYVASVFASNNLFRSVIAGVFPLFARSLYLNLSTERFPVAWGSSILGFISTLMCSIPILFYLNGPRLRARSRFSGLGY